MTTDAVRIHQSFNDRGSIQADEQGRVLPTACPELAFRITGPADHIPDHAPNRRAFNSLCLGIVQATQEIGQVCVGVSSPGLAAGQAIFATN